MWTMKPDQVRQLEQMHSSVQFSHRTQAGKNGADSATAALKDNYMGKVWHKVTVEGTGDDGERRAFQELMATATPTGRPLTPAELVAENLQLKRRLAEAEGSKHPAEARGDANENDGVPTPVPPEQEQSDVNAMTSTDLAMALKSRGLAVPEGDRRTKEWRDQAIAMLTEDSDD